MWQHRGMSVVQNIVQLSKAQDDIATKLLSLLSSMKASRCHGAGDLGGLIEANVTSVLEG